MHDDEGAGLLAVDGVRHGHDADVGDIRMAADQPLDLFRADLFAAAIDVVLDPALERIADQPVDAMRLQEVAGSEEAVGCERFSGRLGILVIARQRARPTEA